MPKMMIPLYAIDVQPWSISLAPTPSDASFGIGRALSTDSRAYSLINTDNGSGEIQTIYTALDTLNDYIQETFGSGGAVKLAYYVRLGYESFIVDGSYRNYFYVRSKELVGDSWDIHDTAYCYGDGDPDMDKVYLESPNPKLTYNGDAETVIYTNFNIAYRYRSLMFDSDSEYFRRNTDYRLQSFMDGALFTIPELQEDRDWSESFSGGFVKQTPTGKVLPYGHKSTHTRRGRRTMTAMFNEISEAEKNTLLAAYRACKGCIPALLMPDENNVGTWIYGKLASWAEREPEAGVWFVEIGIEEY
jgi:hypothetical protein